MVLGTRRIVLWFSFSLAMACCLHAEEEGKVYNGSFEKTAAGGRAPEGWQAAGDKAVVQELTAEQDPTRGHVARLRCTQFVPGTSSSHAMIAQSGHVGVRSGRWYRLSLWARAADLEAGVVQLELANFRSWSSVGLSGSFVPSDDWQRFEFVFRAERDLKPADSRLAIYFLSTGTLWLDDVAIEETTAPRRQWLPAIPMTGVTNALPNSSFEGGEGWGCSAGKYYDWTANLFRRVGQWDESQAFHGKRSWKVTLSAAKPLMIYGGYTQLAAEVRNAGTGPRRLGPRRARAALRLLGLREVRPGRRAGPREPEGARRLAAEQSSNVVDRPGVATDRGELHAQGRVRSGLPWFRPARGGSRGKDALDRRRAVRARHVGLALPSPGRTGSGHRDRRDRQHLHRSEQGPLLPTPGLQRLQRVQGAARAAPRDRLLGPDRVGGEARPGGRPRPSRPSGLTPCWPGGEGSSASIGSPRAAWRRRLRCAVIEPSDEEDAIFGFNHAFGQDFLLPLAHQAGLRWWRDWSTQWDAVQPKRDVPFDFRQPDVHINRVLDHKGRMVVLLPYPSAGWAAACRPGSARSTPTIASGKGMP